jgi:hypothetical protein
MTHAERFMGQYPSQFLPLLRIWLPTGLRVCLLQYASPRRVSGTQFETWLGVTITEPMLRQ